jgi:hypothetical protein
VLLHAPRQRLNRGVLLTDGGAGARVGGIVAVGGGHGDLARIGGRVWGDVGEEWKGTARGEGNTRERGGCSLVGSS